MSHAENTKAIYEAMTQADVSLYDLELWGVVEGKDDELNTTPEDAFDRLIEAGFNLGHSDSIEHYYNATADYVGEALDAHGLTKESDVSGEQGTCRHCQRPIFKTRAGRWIDPEAGYDDEFGDGLWRETCDANDTFTAEHEPVDEPDVLAQAKAVERGEAPSGSVVMKVTGPRSLATPGHACTYTSGCNKPAVAWWHSPFGGYAVYGCEEHLSKMRAMSFNADVEVHSLV